MLPFQGLGFHFLFGLTSGYELGILVRWADRHKVLFEHVVEVVHVFFHLSELDLTTGDVVLEVGAVWVVVLELG